jgi:hypothetical protein
MRRPAVQHADVLAQRVASAGPARLLDGEYFFWRAANRVQLWVQSRFSEPNHAEIAVAVSRDLIDQFAKKSFTHKTFAALHDAAMAVWASHIARVGQF